MSKGSKIFMSNGRKLFNLMKNGGLFILIFAVTFKLIFVNSDFKEVIKAVSQVNLMYILAGVFSMFIVVLCEAVNIKRSLKIFNEKSSLLQCIQYSFAGIFFSAVTPAATGGQPMQVYFMHKRKIDISNSMLALLICLATYQFVNVSIAVTGFILKFGFFIETLGKFSVLLVIGIMLNIFLLLIILAAIFSKKVIYKAVNLCVRVLGYFNAQKAKEFSEKAIVEIEKYKKGAESVKDDKKFIVKTILIALLEVLALHSIPFWVYKAFGLNAANIIEFIFIQAALYITGAALPLPGGVGIGESGFLIFFKSKFPAHILNSAMILSRGISFYLLTIISGISIIFLK